MIMNVSNDTCGSFSLVVTVFSLIPCVQELLRKDVDLQAEKPMLSVGSKVLRNVSVAALEESTRPNLSKPMEELVADATTIQMTDVYDRELLVEFSP